MYGDHIINQLKHHDLKSHNTLHVVGVVSNPVRYHSRIRLARKWIAHMKASPNVVLHLVEAAYGDRQHELDGLVESYLPIRHNQNIWIKEAMINLAVRHLLPADWQYMAWIDADVIFQNEDGWAQETLHQLQHFHVIQPWSDCVDLGPHGDVFQHFRSFGRQHQFQIKKQTHPSQPYQYAHSGFAWACTRKFWENLVPVGGFMWWAVLGSADHHQAFAMIGDVMATVHGDMMPSFKRRAQEWQSAVVRVTDCEVGYCAGLIQHHFHGPKSKRGYRSRWGILIEHEFDPDKDLIMDPSGIPVLTGKPALDMSCHQYNLGRAEDGVSTN